VAGVAAAPYAAYAAAAWCRYGRIASSAGDEHDAVLDRFMPVYEVAERHHIQVAAPAAVVLGAAADAALEQSPVVRSIFRARGWIMRSHGARRRDERGFLSQMRAIGWGTLAEIPGREVVMGAATQPWKADVVFRELPPEHFAAFEEPGYVKIAWTLRADPTSAATSTFRTETRVVATDPTARAKFRCYWALASPGIVLIRWALLRPVKQEAERRARAAAARTAQSSVSNDDVHAAVPNPGAPQRG
jgi:hypothetical protein